MSLRFLRRSGRPAARAAALLPVLLLSGCLYGLRGGGGFPSDVRTIAIQSFDNQTVQFELQDQLFKEVFNRVPGALGLNVAGEQNADAVLSGRIMRYEDVAQNYKSDQQTSGGGIQVLQHEVQVVVSARIVDVKKNLILWENTSVVGRGVYQPDSQDQSVGQQKAIKNVVDQILDGAQSQW